MAGGPVPLTKCCEHKYQVHVQFCTFHLFFFCFLIISFWSVNSFSSCEILGNSDLHTFVLFVFISGVFFFPADDTLIKLSSFLFWGSIFEVSCPCIVSQRMDATPESFQKQTVVFLVWRQQDFCTHKNNAVLRSPPNRLYETGSKLMPWNPFTFSRSVPASGIFRTYLRGIPVSRERQAQRLRVMSPELQRRHSSGTAQAGVLSSSCPAFIWKAPEQRTRNVAGPAIWRGSRPPCSIWHCKHLLSFLPKACIPPVLSI